VYNDYENGCNLGDYMKKVICIIIFFSLLSANVIFCMQKDNKKSLKILQSELDNFFGGGGLQSLFEDEKNIVFEESSLRQGLGGRHTFNPFSLKLQGKAKAKKCVMNKNLEISKKSVVQKKQPVAQKKSWADKKIEEELEDLLSGSEELDIESCHSETESLLEKSMVRHKKSHQKILRRRKVKKFCDKVLKSVLACCGYKK